MATVGQKCINKLLKPNIRVALKKLQPWNYRSNPASDLGSHEENHTYNQKQLGARSNRWRNDWKRETDACYEKWIEMGWVFRSKLPVSWENASPFCPLWVWTYIYDQIKALLCSAPPSQPVEKRGYEWLYIAECAPLSGTICVSLCVYHCQFDMLGLRSLHSGNESYSL